MRLSRPALEAAVILSWSKDQTRALFQLSGLARGAGKKPVRLPCAVTRVWSFDGLRMTEVGEESITK